MSMTLDQWQLGVQILAAAEWAAPGTVSGGDVANPRFNDQSQMFLALTDGTGSLKADTLIFQVRQLTGSSSEELNFFDGSVLDVKGAATGLQTIKSLVIWQIANPVLLTPASSFTVGNASANQLPLNLGAAAQTFTGYKDSVPFIAGRPAGYTVDATHKLVKIINDDATNLLTYMLAVAGNHV